MGAFGAVIPVTGCNLGFPGTVSRTNAANPSIAARLANAANTLNIGFGEACVIQQDATGGTLTSVKDWITNSSGLVTPKRMPIVAATKVLPFAGVAVREVKTMLQYPLPPGTAQVGYYAPGYMCEILQRGSIAVVLGVKTGALAEGQVYLRVLVNAGVASPLGAFEAQADAVTNITGTAAAIGTALTASSGTGTVNGQYVSGLGIPDGTYIASGGGTTSIVLSQSTNAIIAAGTPITFSYTIPLPDTVFRTGVVDANNVAEITIMTRISA